MIMSKYDELFKYMEAHRSITDLKCASKMTPIPKSMPKERVTFLRKSLFRQCIDMQCKKDPELQKLFIAAARELLFDKLFTDSDFENMEDFKPTEQQDMAMTIVQMLFGGLFEGLD